MSNSLEVEVPVLDVVHYLDVECYINVYKDIHGVKPRYVPTDPWELEDALHRLDAHRSDMEEEARQNSNNWELDFWKGLLDEPTQYEYAEMVYE